MTNDQLIELSLIFSTLLSGLYAGTGFFMAMGVNPAIKLMSDDTFAEFWQHADRYMAARMKVFGPILLLMILLSVIAVSGQYKEPPFWCMLAAFCILVADVVFVFSTNHPLNRLVQNWSLGKLPGNVQEIKWKTVRAFKRRIVFMIGAFVMTLFAVWFYAIPHLQ